MENNQETPVQEKSKIFAINLLEKLRQGENFAEIMKNLPIEAYAHKDKCACCSDGRFVPQDNDMEKSCLAGQGILLLFSLDDLNDFVEKMKNNPDKPKAIASHVACGAAGLAHKELQSMIADNKSVEAIFSWLGIDSLPETSDELGEIFTKRLASAVESDYYHMDFQASHDHNESGIIISAIDFDERFIKVGDQQFFNSSSAQFEVSDEYLKTELTKLTEIAFHHGKMGVHSDHYNEADNFYLLVVSNSDQADRLKEIATAVSLNPDFLGKVKVEVFVKE
ncbi:MAG: hypothetical protein WC564_01310 [Patescibacteria group bacterium]|jgi:hypothetical protein